MMDGPNSVFFYLFALFILYACWYAVSNPKLLNSAVALALGFFAIGGLFFMLGSPFLGILQFLINAGAIPIVTVFIIFMTQSRRIRLKSPLSAVLAFCAAVPLGVALFAFFSRYQNFAGHSSNTSVTVVSIKDLGKLILGSPETTGTPGALLAFEVASIILLVAMVGAIVLTKRDGETIKGDVGLLHEIEESVASGKPLESQKDLVGR